MHSEQLGMRLVPSVPAVFGPEQFNFGLKLYEENGEELKVSINLHKLVCASDLEEKF